MPLDDQPHRREPDRTARRRGHAPANNCVRQAGILFVATAGIGLVSDVTPGLIGHGHRVSLYLDCTTLFVGLVLLALQHWRPLGLAAPFVLPALALADVATNNAFGFVPPATYGTWFVLIFVWVGIWYPPWTIAALTPFAVGSYLAPLFVGPAPSSGVVDSVVLVIPAAILAGATVAHFTNRLRSSASEREVLLSNVGRQAVTDELTGVGNRRLGDLLLASLVVGDALALLDLDHFKEINDTYGHPEGDRFLRSFGEFLNSSSRERDAVARMGGEEFMIVVRGAGLEGEAIIARLLESWRSRTPLTSFSAGVAVHKSRSGPDLTYAAADRALYQAKQEGRDRVALARGAR